MKKAKFILAAIILLAIAGGSLAFKTFKRGSFTYYTTNYFNDVAIYAVPNSFPRSTSSSGTKVYWTDFLWITSY